MTEHPNYYPSNPYRSISVERTIAAPPAAVYEWATVHGPAPPAGSP